MNATTTTNTNRTQRRVATLNARAARCWVRYCTATNPKARAHWLNGYDRAANAARALMTRQA